MNEQRVARKRLKRILLALFFVSACALGGIIGAKLNDCSMSQRLTSCKINNPMYRWYVLNKDSSNEVTHSNAKPVACPKDYKAIAVFGQSNSANSVKRTSLKTIHDGRTFMWDWTTQSCYPFAEPVTGTDGKDAGNIITSTIVDFRKKDKETNLIIVTFGRGGSSVFSWSHGIESIRLDEVLKRLKANRIEPVLFFWHQGEADAIEEIYLPEKIKAYGMEMGTKKKFYGMALEIVLKKLHSSFPDALVGVALASVCKNEGSQEVREAQRAIKDKYPWVAVSSDTDVYGNEYRYDKCHFNENGEKYIAADYLKLVFKQIPHQQDLKPTHVR